MIDIIAAWIDQTNHDHKKQRVSCAKFADAFSGFYSPAFLSEAYYVTLDVIPKPNMPELRAMGFGDFIDMAVNGITYKDTYYILPELESALRLHFHELVHVAQWKHLGASKFIEKYMHEIQTVGYEQSPMEKMAYALDAQFASGGNTVDVPKYVAQHLDK